ncbi:hypothetical protein GQR60_14410 [Labilibaculum sp. A4]|uniref:hypothetical protein n=1 Tax=Labilibaculum euxinus TaxID=2686357 RepID=UPI000F61AF8C|nr:hypothetical protein [Labilibaculum euxinus]MDQ1770109.1 hypothetical protein [Labilibaculum euxinus]MWN77530.1 hypothetical protein [Labilibaculum euxinus]
MNEGLITQENIIIKERYILETSFWGTARVNDISSVLNSVIEEFDRLIEDTSTRPLVIFNSEKNQNSIDYPLFQIGPDFNFIFLHVKDTYWCKYAYQFAHEYCHHIIESNFKSKNTRFGWFEESICELASIFILKKMAESWKIKPPYPNWKDYSAALSDYADEILNRKSNSIDEYLGSWINQNLSTLYENCENREINCAIATNLYDTFQAEHELWGLIPFLAKIKVHNEMTWKEYLETWEDILPSSKTKLFELLKSKL